MSTFSTTYPSTPDAADFASAVTTPLSAGHFGSINKIKHDALIDLARLIKSPLTGVSDRRYGSVYAADCYVTEIGRNMTKVGWSETSVPQRIHSIQRDCRQAVSQAFTTERFFAARRAEQIIVKVLAHTAHQRFDCDCGHVNREWFDEKFHWVIALIFMVKQWMEHNDPYNWHANNQGVAGILKQEWVATTDTWLKSLKTRYPISIIEFFVLGHSIYSPSGRSPSRLPGSPGLPRHHSTGAIGDFRTPNDSQDTEKTIALTPGWPSYVHSHSLPAGLDAESPSRNAILKSIDRASTSREQNSAILQQLAVDPVTELLNEVQNLELTDKDELQPNKNNLGVRSPTDNVTKRRMPGAWPDDLEDDHASIFTVQGIDLTTLSTETTGDGPITSCHTPASPVPVIAVQPPAEALAHTTAPAVNTSPAPAMPPEPIIPSEPSTPLRQQQPPPSSSSFTFSFPVSPAPPKFDLPPGAEIFTFSSPVATASELSCRSTPREIYGDKL